MSTQHKNQSPQVRRVRQALHRRPMGDGLLIPCGEGDGPVMMTVSRRIPAVGVDITSIEELIATGNNRHAGE